MPGDVYAPSKDSVESMTLILPVSARERQQRKCDYAVPVARPLFSPDKESQYQTGAFLADSAIVVSGFLRTSPSHGLSLLALAVDQRADPYYGEG